MYRALVIGLVSALLCVGCFNVRDAADPYRLVPPQTYTQWLPPDKIRPEELEVDDLSWLMNKAPLTLAEIIDIALLKNPDTKVSWAEARAKAAQYGQSLKPFFPLVEGEGTYKRSRSPLFGALGRSIVYETFASGDAKLDYLILDFGRTRATSQAALEALYQADFSHNWNIQSTIQTVMDDYYNFLYNKELVRAGEQDVVNAQTALDAVLEKFRTGVADVSDKVQATTRLLNQKLELVSRRQEETIAYTKLSNDMGLPANNFFVSIESYPDQVRLFEIQYLDCFIDKALAKRPDLLASEANVRSKKQLLLAAQRERYPTVDGAFDIGRSYYNNGVGNHYYFDLTVDLSFPIFQGFYISNSIKLAKANLSAAEEELNRTKLAAIESVTNYWNDVQYAQEALVYADEYLKSSEKQFQVELLRYKVGTGTIVELINAQTAVSTASAQLIETIRDWYSSLANLAYATGALTSRFEDATLEKNDIYVPEKYEYTDPSSQYPHDQEDLESAANPLHSLEDGLHTNDEKCAEKLDAVSQLAPHTSLPSSTQSDDLDASPSATKTEALSHPLLPGETPLDSDQLPIKPCVQSEQSAPSPPSHKPEPSPHPHQTN